MLGQAAIAAGISKEEIFASRINCQAWDDQGGCRTCSAGDAGAALAFRERREHPGGSWQRLSP
jgi:hypothetical protein